MNILVNIRLNDGTYKYYAKDTFEYDGHTYQGIINTIGPLPFKLMKNNSFETTTININFNDPVNQQTGLREIRDLIESDLFVNATATIMSETGTTDTLRTISLSKGTWGEGVATLTGKDDLIGLNNNIQKIITESEFPNAVLDAINQPVPYINGKVARVSTGTIKAWRVEKSATEKYLVSDLAVASLQKVTDPSGTDVTSSCSIVYLGGYYYINYATDVDYLMVNCAGNSGGTYDTNLDYMWITLKNRLSDYFYDPLPPDDYFDIGERNYDNLMGAVYQRRVTGAQILKEFCDSFDLRGYYIDKYNIVRLAKGWLDFSTNFTFQDNEVQNFSIGNKQSRFIENFFDPVKQLNDGFSYLEEKSYDFSNKTNFGEFQKKDLSIPLIIDSPNTVYNTVKSRAVNKQFPKIECSFYIPLALRENYDIIPGNEFYLTDENALTEDERYYYIESYEMDTDNELIKINAVDITHLLDIDINTILLLNSDDQNNSEEIYNFAANGWLQFTNNGLYHSTAKKKFGISSIRCDGSSNMVSDINSNAEELAKTDASRHETWCYEMFINFDNAPGSIEVIWDYYLSTPDRIRIRRNADGTLTIRLNNTTLGSGYINMTSLTSFVANTFYHFLIIRDGVGNWGLYVNGSLESRNLGKSALDTIPGATLYIASDGAGAFKTTCYFECERVTLGNPYNLDPTDSLDSFTPPVNPISWYNPTGV